MEITKNQITDLLATMVKIVKHCDEIDEVLGDNVMLEKYGFEIDVLNHLVLDLCGVPKEKTPFATLGIDTKGWHKDQIEYGFCRDSINELIYDDLENKEFENDEELEGCCEAFVMHLLDEWLPDEEYIVE